MKKIISITCIILISFTSKATVHVVKVWDGYYQFVSAIDFSQDITIQLGDTVLWLPLDVPTMVHTITSTNIPNGAAPFDQIWQAPADTVFQYIPQIAGLYEYECTPHAVQFGMVGSINVIGGTSSIGKGVLKPNLTIYPNPANDFIYFENGETVFQYNIYTINGSLILTGLTQGGINIASLATGIYHLEITGDKPRVTKFIKQ